MVPKLLAHRTHCVNGHEITPENLIVTSKQTICRTCNRISKKKYRAKITKEDHKAYYEAHKDVILARNRQYRINNADKIKTQKKEASRLLRAKFSTLKAVAKRKNLDMSLTIEDFARLNVLPCEYCGGALPNTGYGLDRKDNLFGYTQGNSISCCFRCNTMKGEHLTYDEMKMIWLLRLGMKAHARTRWDELKDIYNGRTRST
jgi:hypothetical protein